MSVSVEHDQYLEFEGDLELEGEYGSELEFEGEEQLGDPLGQVLGGEVSGPLAEHEELELASRLLNVSSEQELEQFLGSLVKRAARGVSNFARSSAGRALGGALKGLAKKALPVVGGALGSFVAPGIGTAIGSKLGSLASGLLEMEGELDQHELEFEMARRLVRIGATAARTASRVPPGSGPPELIARRALIGATRRHAPGALLRGGSRPAYAGTYRTRRPAAGGYGSHRHAHRRGGYLSGYGYPLAEDYPVEAPRQLAAGADGHGSAQAGEAGRWVRRGTTIVLLDL
jgi:hypothetical protein